MPDVLLNSDGDLARETVHTYGLQEIIQKINIRLRTNRGEWLLDDSVGVPYLEWLQQRQPPVDDMEAVFTVEVNAVDGVQSVQNITVEVVGEREAVDIEVEVVTEDFGVQEFRESIKIGG